MTRRARRCGPALLLLAALAAVPPTSASLSASARGTSTVGLGTLDGPASLAARASGQAVSITWATEAREAYAVDAGAGPCSTATLEEIASTTSGSASHAVHLPPGATWCYRVRPSMPGTTWTPLGTRPTVEARIGVVVTAVTLANAANTVGCPSSFRGVVGSLDCGDSITIDFSQAIDPATGPTTAHKLCVGSPVDIIFIGATTARGDCSDTGVIHVGKLTGGSLANNDAYAMVPTWSNGGTRLTVLVGDHVRSGYPAAPGPWTFTPTTEATALRSATGSFHVCDSNAGGGSCTPAATGSF